MREALAALRADCSSWLVPLLLTACAYVWWCVLP